MLPWCLESAIDELHPTSPDGQGWWKQQLDYELNIAFEEAADLWLSEMVWKACEGPMKNFKTVFWFFLEFFEIILGLFWQKHKK